MFNPEFFIRPVNRYNSNMIFAMA